LAALPGALPSFPTRRSSDLEYEGDTIGPLREMRTFINGREVKSKLVSKRLETDGTWTDLAEPDPPCETWHVVKVSFPPGEEVVRSEEHTSELQSRENLVCRL